MEYQGTWKEIWSQKGEMEGTKEDIQIFDGWEKSITSMEEIANKIAEFLDIKPDDRVLEVGCGAGGLGRFLSCDYVGIDFSKPLTKKCMEFFGLPAICSEANDIPFKENYFDKCFSWGVFLYFPTALYAKEVLQEMVRVTKCTDNHPTIFVGDIPLNSHNERHMTYARKDFEEEGFTTIRGWAEPYCDVRINAWR